jgi:hypothetical protein
MTRTRENGLRVDAYFPDEAGLAYLSPPKDGAFLNRFTRVFVTSGSQVIEITQADAATKKLDPASTTDIVRLEPGTLEVTLSNPLDPTVNRTLKFPESNIPLPARGHQSLYTAFAPAQLRADLTELVTQGKKCPRPVRVALFFGTGSELGRHGLRTFVDRAFWRIIVNVPGVEPGWDFAAGQRWGIGISDAQIRELVKGIFGREVDFVVDRLLCFSTGYIGATGTIRNQLVNLRNVETFVFFDCNYGELRVKDAIKLLRSATSGRVKVISYASSEAGTPSGAARTVPLDVNSGGTAWLFRRPDFQALTHARVLASGINDNTVSWSEIAPSLRPTLSSLFANLPKRGSVVSEPSIHQLMTGRGPVTGSQTLEAWYRVNRVDADTFLRALWNKSGTASELVRLIWKHKLPGWGGGIDDAVVDKVPAGVFTEGVHDFVPFEFAWEVLV